MGVWSFSDGILVTLNVNDDDDYVTDTVILRSWE